MFVTAKKQLQNICNGIKTVTKQKTVNSCTPKMALTQLFVTAKKRLQNVCNGQKTVTKHL
jgi:hypothetical protein